MKLGVDSSINLLWIAVILTALANIIHMLGGSHP